MPEKTTLPDVPALTAEYRTTVAKLAAGEAVDVKRLIDVGQMLGLTLHDTHRLHNRMEARLAAGKVLDTEQNAEQEISQAAELVDQTGRELAEVEQRAGAEITAARDQHGTAITRREQLIADWTKRANEARDSLDSTASTEVPAEQRRDPTAGMDWS